MTILKRSPEQSAQLWRYVGAGLLGYAALTGLQAVNNIPVKHNDEAALQQAYRQGDQYLQGEDQQQVNDDGGLIDWEAVTAGMAAVGGAASILLLGRKPRSITTAPSRQQTVE